MNVTNEGNKISLFFYIFRLFFARRNIRTPVDCLFISFGRFRAELFLPFFAFIWTLLELNDLIGFAWFRSIRSADQPPLLEHRSVGRPDSHLNISNIRKSKCGRIVFWFRGQNIGLDRFGSECDCFSSFSVISFLWSAASGDWLADHFLIATASLCAAARNSFQIKAGINYSDFLRRRNFQFAQNGLPVLQSKWNAFRNRHRNKLWKFSVKSLTWLELRLRSNWNRV